MLLLKEFNRSRPPWDIAQERESHEGRVSATSREKSSFQYPSRLVASTAFGPASMPFDHAGEMHREWKARIRTDR